MESLLLLLQKYQCFLSHFASSPPHKRDGSSGNQRILPSLAVSITFSATSNICDSSSAATSTRDEIDMPFWKTMLMTSFEQIAIRKRGSSGSQERGFAAEAYALDTVSLLRTSFGPAGTLPYLKWLFKLPCRPPNAYWTYHKVVVNLRANPSTRLALTKILPYMRVFPCSAGPVITNVV